MVRNFFYKHPFFLLIFFSYIFSFLLFGKLTLFYIDKLDNEIVYNSILGKFYRGFWNATDIFLNGEIKIYYFRRLLQPFSLLYIFDTEFIYWFHDLLGKILAYLSFFILSKKIIKNFFFLSISSVFYASSLELVQGTILGYFFPCLPYLVYLIFFKSKLNNKHFFIVALISLNSDINVGIFFFTIFLFFFFKVKYFNLTNCLKILFFFYFFLFLSHINLIYSLLYDGPFHRIEMLRGSEINFFSVKVFYDFLINLFSASFFFQQNIFSYSLAYNLPIFIYKVIFFFSCIIVREKKVFLIFSIILVINLIESFINTKQYQYITDIIPYLKLFSISYISYYLIFLFSIMLLFTLKKIKYLFYPLFFIVLLFQINSSLIPYAKNNISYFKVKDYRNYYTFEGYYLKNTYSKIKNIVKEDRVMSIMWADPMVAVMSGINVVDGYHNLYPLSYKKKFYKVIEKELEQDLIFKNYYLTWGSRVYAPIKDFKNPKINFLEAKKLGAKYVISKEIIYSNNLYKVAEFKDKEKIYLFKIK